MSLKLAVLMTTVAAAGTLLATFGPMIPAASAAPAKFVRCLAAPLAVSSVGHGMWGTTERTRIVAINDWQATASQQIGNTYANWSNALGSDVTCHRELFKVVCVASATPCRT